MVDPHGTARLMSEELIIASRAFGHPVATIAATTGFDAVWVGRYAIDDDVRYIEVYVFDRAAEQRNERWFWPTVRTERPYPGTSIRDVLDQRLQEFVQDVLREDRIDEETMARVGVESQRVAAAAAEVPCTLTVEGRSAPGIRKTWHDDSVTSSTYSFTAAELGEGVCVVVARPVAFQPELHLVGGGPG